MARKPHLVLMTEAELGEYHARLLQEFAAVLAERLLRKEMTAYPWTQEQLDEMAGECSSDGTPF